MKHRSVQRFQEVVAWERATLQPKYGLPFGACQTLTEGTAELYDYDWFFAPFMINPEIGRAVPPGRQLIYFPRRGFDLWNTRYFILPAIRHNDVERGTWSLQPRTEPIEPAPNAFQGPGGPEARARWDETRDFVILRNRDALPRAWVVHSARLARPIVGLGRADRQAIMTEILYPGDEFWAETGRRTFDPRLIAWIELEDPSPLRRLPQGESPRPGRGHHDRLV